MQQGTSICASLKRRRFHFALVHACVRSVCLCVITSLQLIRNRYLNCRSHQDRCQASSLVRAVSREVSSPGSRRLASVGTTVGTMALPLLHHLIRRQVVEAE